MWSNQVLGGPQEHKGTFTPGQRGPESSVSLKAEECSNCALLIKIKRKENVYSYKRRVNVTNRGCEKAGGHSAVRVWDRTAGGPFREVGSRRVSTLYIFL